MDHSPVLLKHTLLQHRQTFYHGAPHQDDVTVVVIPLSRETARQVGIGRTSV